MELGDIVLLLHPLLAIAVVFPLIGIVVNRAFQTRQRRLKTASGEKSKIPPVVGQEHVQLGRWLTISSQEGVYHNTEKWYLSHYYYGMTAAFLMIFSLAILRDIYQDRSNRWRKTHIVLNLIALPLFIIQGFTGSLSLLEAPLHWQKSYIQTLYEQNCNQQPCLIQSAPKMP